MPHLSKNITLNLSYSPIAQALNMDFSHQQDRELYPYEKEAIDTLINQMDKINARFIHQHITVQLLRSFKEDILSALEFVYDLTGVEIGMNDTQLHL